MSWRRKLEGWRAAGLVSDEAARAILAHEAAHHRPWALYVLVGMGALAIGTGLIALVAANWEELGAALKLGADLLLGAGLAAGLRAAVRGGRRVAREALVIVYLAWTLASIGLVGQVYQLGGAPWQALLAWTVLTLPLVSLAELTVAPMAWLAGLLWAYGEGEMALLGTLHGRAEALREAVAIGLLALPLPACLVASTSARLRARAPGLAAAAGRYGLLALALAALAAPFMLYAPLSQGALAEIWPALLLGGAAAAGVASLAPRLIAAWAEPSSPEAAARLVLGGRLLVVAIYLMAAVPLAVPHERHEAVAAALFCALWLAIGVLAAQAGRARVASLATGLVAVRVLAIYLEVFGSLLSTGLGLISGGGVALALAWAWSRFGRGLGRPKEVTP